MRKSLVLCFALAALVSTSCKNREGGGASLVLEDEARAQNDEVLTSDKKKVYPSKKMVAAAAKALSEAQGASDPKKFKALVRLAKLQLRMRPAGTKQSSGAGGAGQITCTLASPAGSQTDTANIAVAAAEDEYVSSNGFKYKFKNEENETVNYTYSFNLSVSERDGGQRVLDVYFQENEVVQDETGSFSCNVPAGAGMFCEEPIENEGAKVGDFFCRRT